MIYFESAIFIGWALAVVLFDWQRRSIPNSLVAAGGVFALAFAALGISPFQTAIGFALLGALAGFAALLPFYLLGMMGAADVKAFAVLGAWCGPRELVGVWVAASLAAAVHALVLLARREDRVVLSLRSLAAHASVAERRRNSTPYGALLAAAGIGQLALHLLNATGRPT
ncbi:MULTISPECIES: A24 family peptidase [unclassified Caballeronia]|uniref:A24 family peptidase n=1 Tax=unclassified Caballeronia TaxID=2646786 RepID=UPI002865665C|nr:MULTISPECIES: A24 family peptidase [unclassified Caballeronia]MDR5774073.1 A24 family peptidase [Caballeronia sp. LZ002]MDR5849508.1 A24 family peptidase [Caballeronia sp. LZ003]